MWPWTWGQGHQNLTTCCHPSNSVSVQVWSKSTHWFRRQDANNKQRGHWRDPHQNNNYVSTHLRLWGHNTDLLEEQRLFDNIRLSIGSRSRAGCRISERGFVLDNFKPKCMKLSKFSPKFQWKWKGGSSKPTEPYLDPPLRSSWGIGLSVILGYWVLWTALWHNIICWQRLSILRHWILCW